MNLFGPNPYFFTGNFVYEKQGRFGPRVQKNLQLVYIYEGNATIWIDDVPHFLGDNEITLLLPGRVERFAFSDTAPTHHGWCEVNAPKLEKKTLEAYDTLPFALPMSDRLKALAALALEVQPCSQTSAQRLYQSLGQSIFHEYFFQAGFGDLDEKLPPALTKACKKIEQDYQQPLTMDDLTKAANVSGSRLNRIFKEHMDITPIRYLWRVRVEMGTKLLTETGLTISEIAFSTGFQTPFHFSRLVKTYYGQSPKTIRQKAWNQ